MTEPVSRRSPKLAVSAAALSLVAGGFFLVRSPEAESAVPPERPVVEGDRVTLGKDAPGLGYIRVDEAKEARALPMAPAPGHVAVDALRTSALAAPLPGRVERVLVRVGDRVKKGQRLVSIRSGALAELERDVSGASAHVDARRKLVAHLKELVALQSAPARELVEAEESLAEAELELKTARELRKSLVVSDSVATLLWVTSPRDGTVVDLSVYADQQVSPDAEQPLLRVADLREVLVHASVQERDATGLVPGKPVEVRLRGGRTAEGVLEAASDLVDPQRRTVELRIRVDNPDHLLRPNAFVEVAFPEPEEATRVRVSSRAVVTDGRESVVFLADGGAFTRTPVRLGRERAGEVEILDGLSAGSAYVSDGALLLLNVVDLAR